MPCVLLLLLCSADRSSPAVTWRIGVPLQSAVSSLFFPPLLLLLVEIPVLDPSPLSLLSLLVVYYRFPDLETHRARIGTDTGCVGCRRVERTIQCEKHAHRAGLIAEQNGFLKAPVKDTHTCMCCTIPKSSSSQRRRDRIYNVTHFWHMRCVSLSSSGSGRPQVP